VITRAQLLALGFSTKAIEHRLAKRRLFPVHRGVYAVGRSELPRHGRWMGAVLACGQAAALSHEDAAGLYGFGLRRWRPPEVHVSVPAVGPRLSRSGIVVHRRAAFEVRRFEGIPVTTPECTLIDLAATRTRDDLEEGINQADIRRLTNPERLRRALDEVGPRPGARTLRLVLDIATFRFTRSRLERAFIPIALRAGLPRPLTAQVVNGEEVDFFWPDLGLVVETDGLTYHRTPQQQAKDLKRDQKHIASGLTSVRFSHGQIRYQPKEVEAVLRDVAARLLPA
jgi:hypothetical protein